MFCATEGHCGKKVTKLNHAKRGTRGIISCFEGIGPALTAAEAGSGCDTAGRCLLSAPGGQRQVSRFVAIVDGRLQLDDDRVGGGGLSAGRHCDGQHGEDGVRREQELLLPLHVRLLHQVHVLAPVPAAKQPSRASSVRARKACLSVLSPRGSTWTIQ